MHVLAIGAHPDDIELGSAGALLAHRDRGHTVSLLVMSTGEAGLRDGQPREGEQRAAADLLGAELFWGGFPDAGIPEGGDAIRVIESMLDRTGADVVYTHAPGDTHQDHRAVATATASACRRHTRVLHYEAPSSVDFQPNVYVDVAGTLDRKLRVLRAHTSQVLKNGLVDLEHVQAVARHRGFTARLCVAEAFSTRRFLWDLGSRLPDPMSLDSLAEEPIDQSLIIQPSIHGVSIDLARTSVAR